MPDMTIKAVLLPELDEALAGVLALSPPATPRGRYALAKAAKAVGPAAQLFREQHLALCQQHAKKDAEGNPITRSNGRPNAVTFELVDAVAFDKDFKALGSEEITLPGLRLITHAELGACPITGHQEKTLLGVLLIDEEPPE